MINIQKMENNIITLSFDARDTPVNIITESSLSHLETLTAEIIRDKNTQGLIFTSAKKEFILGVDLSIFLDQRSPKEIYELSQRLQRVFRELEQWGRPVVAAINGSALGAGLELALACHYRVAINHRSVQLGLPEAKLGLMPGGGGIQRLTRLVGIENSLPLLLDGITLSSTKAKELGIIDALVETKNDLLENAIAYIQQNPRPQQYWQSKRKWQGPLSPHTPEGRTFFSEMAVKVQQKYRGHGKGPQKILSCLYEGSLLELDPACEIESRAFSELFHLETSQKMIKTLFFGVNRCKSLGSRKIETQNPIHHIGIVGAGVMGQGIAQTAAMMGVNVLLKEKEISSAEMGRNLISKKLDHLITQKELPEDSKSVVMDQIKCIETFDELKNCDIIIEVIEENIDSKKQILKAIEEHVSEETTIITNTSSLPIEQLNKALQHPQRFIGLHFFAPVVGMPLVEIVMGNETSQEALIKALTFADQLEKVPLVVRDGHGFFTTRVMVSYICEAILCLHEGISPALIENAGISLGFSSGPLALADQFSLSTIRSLLREKIKMAGKEHDPEDKDQLVLNIFNNFLTKHERSGLRSKKGFYDYTDHKKSLCDLTRTYQKETLTPISFEEIKARLFNIQLVETMKCFEEGVLNTAHEGDVASILGWGFPPETGGIVTSCHKLGNEKLLEELNKMALQWGERFTPPKILKTLINKNYSTLHEAREILASAILEE